MKLLLSTLCFLCIWSLSAQQYETVVFNYEKSYFGENASLPAEKYFMLSGPVSTGIPMVEVQIFSGQGRKDRAPIYQTYWKRGMENKEAVSYSIPINYKLRQNSEYDLLLQYFRPTTPQERDTLRRDLEGVLEAYLEQNIQTAKRGFDLSRSPAQMLKELNSLVIDGMQLYRHRIRFQFESFSDLIADQLKDLQQSRKKGANRGASITLLLRQMRGELQPFFANELYLLLDDRFIEDYPTERTRAVLALNAGYAGIPFNYDSNNFNYGAAPYLGLSFPLGKKNFSPFWHRTALSVGAFLARPQDQNGLRAQGPVSGVPLYGALSYRPWRFLRVHAGATVLENPDNAIILGLDRQLNVRPFVGVSIEFSLWMNLAD